MRIKDLLAIRRDERLPVVLASLYMVLLNTLNVAKYYDRFHVLSDNFHDLFWSLYHVSGYDLITYHTLSEWDVRYEVTRHPLLAFLMYPLSLLNKGLMFLTESNWATLIVAIVWSVSAVYSFVFLYRILHELMSVGKRTAFLLCALYYSMGFSMLAIFVPDHFGPSMTLLLLSIYIIGRKTKKGRLLSVKTTILLFIAMAGITLSNGVKVFLAALINRRKVFFSIKYLALAVAIPSFLIFGFAKLEEEVFVKPRIEAQKKQQAIVNARHKEELKQAYCDTAKVIDQAAMAKAVNTKLREEAWAKFRHNKKQAWSKNAGKPISKEGYARWTDISTPRWQSLVENVFGEPVQLHENFLIEDINISRPVIVKYNHAYNYLVELLLIILALAGIFIARNNKVVWMVLSFFMFDMLLHFILGFGLNEVYIMSPHYLFIFPICIAPLLTGSAKIKKISIAVVAMLTMWLYYWNLSLLLPWFMETV